MFKNLKQVSILFALMFVAFQGIAQEYRKEIQEATENYIKINEDLDVDGIMEHVYPKIFEIVPEDAFRQQYKQLFESEEMEIGFGDFVITEILDKTVEFEGEIFGVVRYAFDMTMKFADSDADEFILAAFNEEYGEDNVAYDAETATFSLNVSSEMFAIKMGSKWYFIENKPELEAIIGQLIPDEVRTAFGDEIKTE